MNMRDEKLVRVAGSSQTAKVAGAIAGIVRETGHTEVQAIGAAAVNQAVKAIVRAREYLEQDGIEIFFIPEFVDVEFESLQHLRQ